MAYAAGVRRTTAGQVLAVVAALAAAFCALLSKETGLTCVAFLALFDARLVCGIGLQHHGLTAGSRAALRAKTGTLAGLAWRQMLLWAGFSAMVVWRLSMHNGDVVMVDEMTNPSQVRKTPSWPISWANFSPL